MIPLRWWILDRCAFRGRRAVVEAVVGDTVCVSIGGAVFFGTLADLDLVPFTFRRSA